MPSAISSFDSTDKRVSHAFFIRQLDNIAALESNAFVEKPAKDRWPGATIDAGASEPSWRPLKTYAQSRAYLNRTVCYQCLPYRHLAAPWVAGS